jgi:uncharacterized protein (TIGR02246 family)
MSALLKSTFVLAFGPLLLAAPKDTSAIEKAVLETHAQMIQAAQAVDVDRLFGFMLETDKGSLIQNGKLLLTREEAREQVRANLRGIRKIEYRWKHEHVMVVSPTIAVLTAEGESSATTEQGETFSAPFAQTVVFVLTGGQWKVLHAHQSSPRR